MKVGDKNNIFTKCRLTELNAAAIFFCLEGRKEWED